MNKNKRIKRKILRYIRRFLSRFRTQTIPIESFKKQFGYVDEASMRTVNTDMEGLHFFRDPFTYRANQIKYIRCFDRKGNPVAIKNAPSINIRFYKRYDTFWTLLTKRTLLFDTIYMQDSMIIGKRSRFLDLEIAIPIDEVIKIKLQDDHKSFKYTN